MYVSYAVRECATSKYLSFFIVPSNTKNGRLAIKTTVLVRLTRKDRKRESPQGQNGRNARGYKRTRGRKHPKAHPREGSQARKGAPAREGAPPRERTPAREGAPARREFNPGMRARLRWLRLAASGGGWLQHHFANAHPEAFGDGCRAISLRQISEVAMAAAVFR